MHNLAQLVKKHWLLLSLIVLSINTFVSLMPFEKLPSIPGSDKTHHFITYALLFFPVALARPAHWRLVALFLLLWSGAIELIQPYVNRYGEWLDFLANAVGMFCGFLIAWLIKKIVD